MLLVRGADVLLEDGLGRVDVLVVEDRIAAIGPEATTAAGAAEVWQADGLMLLPGIVDLHGDAFERQVMPRPGVTFPLDVALLETDRQMVANGITTAFHGLTWSWEPGLRGRAAAHDFLASLERMRGRLACDTLVHLRHETYNLDAVDEVFGWLRDGRIALLAFNDHVPMILEKAAKPGGLAPYAERTGMTPEAFCVLLDQVSARAAEVPATVRRLAAEAVRTGVVMASHDDETPQMRQWYHDIGCTLCEFPVNRETAAHGQALGNPVIMGAPNVLRGGSHAARLSAADLLGDGTCNVLTSDYYYPALLQAPFLAARQSVCSFAEAWATVSGNPARAAGLSDRGSISQGLRADLLVVESSGPVPHAVATLVAGRPVHLQDIWRLRTPPPPATAGPSTLPGRSGRAA